MLSDLLQQVSLLDTDAELDRRLDEHLANPDDVFSWEQVKAELLAKIANKDSTSFLSRHQ